MHVFEDARSRQYWSMRLLAEPTSQTLSIPPALSTIPHWIVPMRQGHRFIATDRMKIALVTPVHPIWCVLAGNPKMAVLRIRILCK